MLKNVLRFDLIKFLIFLLFLGFLPLTTQGIGYNFIPSMEWIATTKYIVYFVTLLSALFFLLVFYCMSTAEFYFRIEWICFSFSIIFLLLLKWNKFCRHFCSNGTCPRF